MHAKLFQLRELFASFRPFNLAAVVLFAALPPFAHADNAQLCAALTKVLGPSRAVNLPNPSREPTAAEMRLIDEAKIPTLTDTGQATGMLIVDANNDGKDDVFVWSIGGTAKAASGEVFEIASLSNGETRFVPAGRGTPLGFFNVPTFARYDGVNYIFYSSTSDNEGVQVVRMGRNSTGARVAEKVCVMQNTAAANTNCVHPACVALGDLIRQPSTNRLFSTIARPHPIYVKAGLEAYFSRDLSSGDIDNTGASTEVWRLGETNYGEAHVLWNQLDFGEDRPSLELRFRDWDAYKLGRGVVKRGKGVNRLARTLEQQSKVLSKVLNREVRLPSEGEFLLFKSKDAQTYWGWDLGNPPTGKEIHVLYSTGAKAKYVGAVRVALDQKLVPCTWRCEDVLGR